jgi:L-fuculose-phosphate aldolase
MSVITERAKRQSIIDACRSMNTLGINQGTSGNISLRHKDGLLITPTSVPYETMQPKQIVFMGMDGSFDPAQRPSSEWRFHLDILRARPEINAVVHAHPPYSTILAIMGLEIPPIHYMIACAGGDTIRCAPYATFGTQELSEHAVRALEDRLACLLEHHGMIAIGALAVEGNVACGRSRDAGAAIPRLPSDRHAATVAQGGDQERSRQNRRLWSVRQIAAQSTYFATKPASFISAALSLSSSSRNFTISLPVRKIGFNACFSM